MSVRRRAHAPLPALLTRSALALIVAGIVYACAPAPDAAESDTAPVAVATRSPQVIPLANVAASEEIPERMALGRAATEAEITRWDIDIMPDGRGLPSGSGSVEDGAAVYATRCAPCHGVQGEGTPLGGVLISEDAEAGFRRRVVGHYWPYATTAFDYIRRAMPWDTPGTLSNDEVYAVVAFLLAENGVIADEVVLDAATLGAIEMPSRDRFVTDDRMTDNRVR